MADALKNCWQIMNCGREKGGVNVNTYGECISSSQGLGHSCWAIAGTLSENEIQCIAARKQQSCIACEVYKRYHRLLGTHGLDVVRQCPVEQKRYKQLAAQRMMQKMAADERP